MNDEHTDRLPKKDSSPAEWYEPETTQASPEDSSRPAEPNHTHTNLPPGSAGSPQQYRAYGAGYYPYTVAGTSRGNLGAMRIIGITIFLLVIVAALMFASMSGVKTVDSPGLYEPPQQTATPGGEGNIPTLEEYFRSVTSSKITIPKAGHGGGVVVNLAPQPENEALSLQEVYKKCSASVVAISAELAGNAGSQSWGTGIILTSDGYIITNAHVLESASAATVILEDGSECEARLVGYDTASDIAVLKIDKTGLEAAEIGDSTELVVGDGVVAIGNPLGENFRGTMTDGIISAIDRDVGYLGGTMALLQTNTAINEGNSGGPLINMYGQVIGITNMKMSSYYYGTTIEGIGFAIPTSTMKQVVDSIIAIGYVPGKPGIGITVGPVPEEYLQSGDYPEGLYITEVNVDSDAFKKGVRIGDIMTAVNGIRITTNDEVSAIKNELEIGDSMTLTLYRDGEYLEIEILLVDMSLMN